MSTEIIGLIVFGVMLAMIMIGVHVPIAVLSCACVGLYFVGGAKIVATQFSSGFFNYSTSYNFAVLPLFLIVGVLAGITGMAKGTFDSARKWLGKRKGGLLYVVIGANAIFGACSGISTAGTVVFSQIAAPEMISQGYDDKLTYGCIASSGSLSVLIPPSVGILMVCLLTDNSIGTGLMCGLGTGIVMIAILFLLVFAIVRIKPNKIPAVSEADKNVTWKERFVTLKLLLPIVVLFAIIVGGSFFGWFPATVGGAIAAVAMLIYSICKKIPLKKIYECVWDGAQIFAGIFPVIVGGQMFGRLIGISGLTRSIVNLISNSGISPYLVFILVLIFYAICGCMMDCMSIIMITAPMVFSMLTGLGFNGFVIVVMLVLLAELGGITPPVGLSVFTVATTLKIEPSKVFRGALPFLLAYVALLLLGLFIPDIFLWLPRLLGMAV